MQITFNFLRSEEKNTSKYSKKRNVVDEIDETNQVICDNHYVKIVRTLKQSC